MKFIYFSILNILFLCACTDSQKSQFTSSFKELKSSDASIKNQELIDTNLNIYSNFKYNIAFDGPNHWEFDYGISEHTIYRTYQRDSAVSFAINVVELNTDKDPDFTIWELIEKNSELSDESMKSMVETQLNNHVKQFTSKKIHIKNEKAIKRTFEIEVKDIDFEYDASKIMI